MSIKRSHLSLLQSSASPKSYSSMKLLRIFFIPRYLAYMTNSEISDPSNFRVSCQDISFFLNVILFSFLSCYGLNLFKVVSIPWTSREVGLGFVNKRTIIEILLNFSEIFNRISGEEQVWLYQNFQDLVWLKKVQLSYVYVIFPCYFIYMLNANVWISIF